MTPLGDAQGTPRERAAASVAAMTTTLRVTARGETRAYADSLAARLGRMPGLTVRPAGGRFGPHSEFTVRGDVTARDGRLVVAARLFRRPSGDAVWTATFWRTDSLTSDLVSDLGAAVAEAVYGQLARSAMTTTGERP